jgi:outer membrane lipoprotein-sorting protein
MSISTSRPALRWGVPIAVLVTAVGGGTAVRTLTASADPTLPPRTAAQLLVDVQNARLDGASGTVVQRADLGLPALPGLGGQGSSSLSSVVTGSHTFRVWYSGPDKARIALLGTLGESDVITNGRDLWMWDSQRNTASHSVLPARQERDKRPTLDPNRLPKTPQEAANAALAAISPTTQVSTSGAARVAGRPAYELILTPRDTGSLVGRVTVAIDAEQHVPLRVQVYPSGADAPAFEVSFTQVAFARPNDAQFRFTPPPGAKVTEEGSRGGSPETTPRGTAPHERQTPTIVGEGWTSVLVAKVPAGVSTNAANGRPGFSLDSLPRVSGAWGSGRLLTGRLFSVLLTDDGRLVAGAVKPERLYEALAK